MLHLYAPRNHVYSHPQCCVDCVDARRCVLLVAKCEPHHSLEYNPDELNNLDKEQYALCDMPTIHWACDAKKD